MASRPADARAIQLRLDLNRDPSYDPDEFLVTASNARAHATIEAWPQWPHRVLLLIGPPGTGKSHLGAIWAARSGARIVGRDDALDVSHWPTPVTALVEDCDRSAHAEADLFHLLNLARETEGWLMLTARTPPDRWRLQTPDLLSRLRLAPAVAMEPPDVELLKAVLVKLFADRQIRIDADVVGYAARHCEQSLEAIDAFVAGVDDDALAEGRRITRSLAARVISRQSAASDEVSCDLRSAKEKPAPGKARVEPWDGDAGDQGPT